MDGKTHINIYSKGKTELGRTLSNFYPCKVNTPDGKFLSVEGYWYWLTKRDDRLRKLYGYKAKKLGSSLGQATECEDFEKRIKTAVYNKIHDNPDILSAFKKNRLPYRHYYVRHGNIVDAGHKWLVKYIESVQEKYVDKDLF